MTIHKKHLKKIKRAKKLAGRKQHERDTQIFMAKVGGPQGLLDKIKAGTLKKKKKEKKPLPKYKVIKLTKKMDRLNKQIQEYKGDDKELEKLKNKLDIIKNKLK